MSKLLGSAIVVAAFATLSLAPGALRAAPEASEVEPSSEKLSGEASSNVSSFVTGTVELEATTKRGVIDLATLERARNAITPTTDQIRMMDDQRGIYTKLRAKYLPRLMQVELATAKLLGFDAVTAYGNGARVAKDSVPQTAREIASSGPTCTAPKGMREQGPAWAAFYRSCVTKWVGDQVRANPTIFRVSLDTSDGIVTLFKQLDRSRSQIEDAEDNYYAIEVPPLSLNKTGCGSLDLSVQRIGKLTWEVFGTIAPNGTKRPCKFPRTNVPSQIAGVLNEQARTTDGDTFTLLSGPTTSTEMIEGRPYKVTGYEVRWFSKKMSLDKNPCDPKDDKVLCTLGGSGSGTVQLIHSVQELAYTGARFDIRAKSSTQTTRCRSLAESAVKLAAKVSEEIGDRDSKFHRDAKSGYRFKLEGEAKPISPAEFVKRATALVERYGSATLADGCAK